LNPSWCYCTETGQVIRQRAGDRGSSLQPWFSLSARRARARDLALSSPTGWKPTEKLVLQRSLEVTLSPAVAWPAPCKTWLGGCAERDHALKVVPVCPDSWAVALGVVQPPQTSF